LLVKYCPLLVLVVLLGPACHSVQPRQKSGTEFQADKNGHTKGVTYVTPEEYDRMTPEERHRQQVDVGVEVSGQLGGKPRSEPVSEDDLAKAMSEKK
jgi:hypothetical protein